MQIRITVKRKPWVAGLLSAVFPGVGQLYNGQFFKAAFLLLFANVILVYLCIGLMSYGPFQNLANLLLCIILSVSVYVSIVKDAICEARKLHAGYELKAFNKWYVYLTVGVLAGLVGDFVSEPILKENIRRYVQAFKIPGKSMVPTLLVGDHVLIDKSVSTDGQTPNRGDIIVFKFPEDENKEFVKRVIGLPGDIIQVRQKLVYVNGAVLDDATYAQLIDPQLIEATVNPRDNVGPVTIPDGSYFVMGDNRDQSLDSRFFGSVHLSKIMGKLSLIYWSWDDDHWSVRWDRIGRSF